MKIKDTEEPDQSSFWFPPCPYVLLRLYNQSKFFYRILNNNGSNVMLRKLNACACILILTAIMAGCYNPNSDGMETKPADIAAQTPAENTKLVVFAAGSLIVPFQELEKAFEETHPGVDVQMEYHGSIQVIRHVTELHEPIDVVATADASLIPQFMFAVEDEQTGQPYADWYIRFAGNKLALAYHPDSQYAAEITPENWAEILANPDVRLGLSDPRFDALGYRAFMAVALQEQLQKNYRLFNDIFAGQFTTPVTIFREDDSVIIHVPEILETTSSSHIHMRGASIQLVALLESRDIDYAFEYESVIRQHGLQMLELPDQVNLSQAHLDPFYDMVEVELDFKRFSSLQPNFQGEHIAYGITIPGNAPQPETAEAFIQFLLSETGRKIMAENYHPVLEHPQAAGYESMPPGLKQITIQE